MKEESRMIGCTAVYIGEKGQKRDQAIIQGVNSIFRALANTEKIGSRKAIPGTFTLEENIIKPPGRAQENMISVTVQLTSNVEKV